MTLPRIRPLFRWYGGKWYNHNFIHKNLAAYDCLIDCYGGSGAITATSRAQHRIYNDLDGRLTRVFRSLTDPKTVAEARRLLESIPMSQTIFRETSEKWHNNTDMLTDAQCIWATVYLSRGSFGGWGVTSSSSTFSPIHGTYSPIKISVLDNFIRLWRGVTVINDNALNVVKLACENPGHFVRYYKSAGEPVPKICLYCDPPYILDDKSQRRGGGVKYKYEASAKHLEKLVRYLKKAATYPHIVCGLSGYNDDPSILNLKDAGWVIHEKVDSHGAQTAGISHIEALAVSCVAHPHLF